jgi:hypothetical protein
MIMINHQRIVIIPDGEIKNEGDIDLLKKSSDIIRCFTYDIHDIFGDVRGKNRESQLYLAALMASLNTNTLIDPI